MSVNARPLSFISKSEKYIPIFLFLLFVAVTIPGISWGVPHIWNPDELVNRVDSALHGNFSYFDQTNFDYPSLPKYVMYGIGFIIYRMGYTKTVFMIVARLMSVFLGGLAVVLTYKIARQLGANIYAGCLSGLLMLFSSDLTHNARFAHNDLYLTFFVILVIYFSLKYLSSNQRIWL
jgi:dolichyl-phosphate-mannose--protein O-mannosyl transferase